jgi:hypothetical protein
VAQLRPLIAVARNVGILGGIELRGLLRQDLLEGAVVQDHLLRLRRLFVGERAVGLADGAPLHEVILVRAVGRGSRFGGTASHLIVAAERIRRLAHQIHVVQLRVVRHALALRPAVGGFVVLKRKMALVVGGAERVQPARMLEGRIHVQPDGLARLVGDGYVLNGELRAVDLKEDLRAHALERLVVVLHEVVVRGRHRRAPVQRGAGIAHGVAFFERQRQVSGVIRLKIETLLRIAELEVIALVRSELRALQRRGVGRKERVLARDREVRQERLRGGGQGGSEAAREGEHITEMLHDSTSLCEKSRPRVRAIAFNFLYRPT